MMVCVSVMYMVKIHIVILLEYIKLINWLFLLSILLSLSTPIISSYVTLYLNQTIHTLLS